MATRTPTPRALGLTVALSLPLVGLALFLARPELDFEWEHHPSHFWLVVTAAVGCAALAYVTGVAARRRGDARVFLISVGFLTGAGFLGLHALATPGVLLDSPSTGFAMATPVGLIIGSVPAAASSFELSGEQAVSLMRRAGLLQNTLLGIMLLWGIASLAGVPPLDDPDAPERASGPLIAVAAVGVGLYGLAAVRYLRIYQRRTAPLLMSIAVACVLLGEAVVAVAFGRNWHATWWEWHLLIAAGILIVLWHAHRQWHEERFSDLYLDQTAAGQRDISVLFADLAGFTSFSERQEPGAVSAMLNEYFQMVIPPVVERYGGEIDRIIGDALMVTFNRRGDQPDHPVRAARAALALQEATEAAAARHPGWPRFRVGVNSGEALITILGTAGGRTHTAIGDVVNIAARLESAAPIGGVAIGGDTARRVPGARTEPQGEVQVKGRDRPVEVHRLLGIEQ
jgi:adenylate cyclase